MERGGLVSHLCCRDVGEKRADGVALFVMDVVELVHRQAGHRRDGRGADVIHHGHKPPDLRREAGDVSHEQVASFDHGLNSPCGFVG